MQSLYKRVSFLIVTVLLFLGIYKYLLKPLADKESQLGGKGLSKRELMAAEEVGELIPAIAEKLHPSVVFVKTEATKTAQTFFGPMYRYKQEGSGSGIIISRKGYVATNAHVVIGAERVSVILNNRKEYDAELIGLDSLTDIAVIKIKAKTLIPAPLGDSDSLEVGEWIIAVGSPRGLFNSVTFGIVSALGRQTSFATEMYEDYIQTDASINLGNSGGPLINLDGEVVGMNTLIYSPSGGNVGIGFAIPSNIMHWVAEFIINKGAVIRGWLGVELQSLDKNLVDALDLASMEGALVSKVLSPSPASKAELMEGDVILKFDRKKVLSIHDLRNRVARSRPGARIKLEIFREGETIRRTVTLGQKGAQKDQFVAKSRKKKRTARKYKSKKLGITVVYSSGETGGKKSIRIIKSAWDKTFSGHPQVGDVILKVNTKTLQDIPDFKKAEKKIRSNQEVLLLLSRRGTIFYTSITAK
jgi:serine protease Do